MNKLNNIKIATESFGPITIAFLSRKIQSYNEVDAEEIIRSFLFNQSTKDSSNFDIFIFKLNFSLNFNQLFLFSLGCGLISGTIFFYSTILLYLEKI